MSKKAPSPPAWWKNTYFWLALILFLVGVIGLPFVGGDRAIRDPGQRDESGLVWIYWGGAIVMLINGILSHRETVLRFGELGGKEE